MPSLSAVGGIEHMSELVLGLDQLRVSTVLRSLRSGINRVKWLHIVFYLLSACYCRSLS